MFHFLTNVLRSRSQTAPNKFALATLSRRKLRPTFDVLETREVPSAASLVRDINPGGPGSAPTEMVNMNGQLFFTADDGIHGRELWTSDPASGATHMVVDINLGTTGSVPFYLTVVGNRLFFSAADGLRGGA